MNDQESPGHGPTTTQETMEHLAAELESQMQAASTLLRQQAANMFSPTPPPAAAPAQPRTGRLNLRRT